MPSFFRHIIITTIVPVSFTTPPLFTYPCVIVANIVDVVYMTTITVPLSSSLSFHSYPSLSLSSTSIF